MLDHLEPELVDYRGARRVLVRWHWYVFLVYDLDQLNKIQSVCGILTIYTEATLRDNNALLNASNLVPFITSMLSLTLVTNLLTTCKFLSRLS